MKTVTRKELFVDNALFFLYSAFFFAAYVALLHGLTLLFQSYGQPLLAFARANTAACSASIFVPLLVFFIIGWFKTETSPLKVILLTASGLASCAFLFAVLDPASAGIGIAAENSRTLHFSIVAMFFLGGIVTGLGISSNISFLSSPDTVITLILLEATCVSAGWYSGNLWFLDVTLTTLYFGTFLMAAGDASLAKHALAGSYIGSFRVANAIAWSSMLVSSLLVAVMPIMRLILGKPQVSGVGIAETEQPS